MGIRWQGQACVGPAHAVLPRSNRLWTLRSLGYQCHHDLWFRSIDGVAPCLFHCCRPCTLGPAALRCRRNHFVFGRDQAPTGLVAHAGRLISPPSTPTPHGPCVSHERGLVRVDVRRERGVKLRLIQEQEAVLRRQDRGDRCAGRRSLISDDTNSPLSWRPVFAGLFMALSFLVIPSAWRAGIGRRRASLPSLELSAAVAVIPPRASDHARHPRVTA